MNVLIRPHGVAVDWLDAYRAASVLDILNLYDGSASVECGCGGHKTIFGNAALAAYWQQRFKEIPASELEDLQLDGDAIVPSYRVPKGVVQAKFYFTAIGKIARTVCGPYVVGEETVPLLKCA